MAITIPERLIGPAILALAFAANAIHNHTALGGALGHIPGFYPIGFFIGIGVVLPRPRPRSHRAPRACGGAPTRRRSGLA